MSKISRTVVFEHVQRFVREVYADRLRQAGFSSYRNEDIHWYKLVNNDVIHAVYFVTDYMSFPVNLEIRYGCHPLFIPPVFQRSSFVDTSYGYEQMYDIIPELIEIGVDVLNPVQPECVDPVALKEQYGDRLSFWGTIGTQTTMPVGTPEEVRENVRHMIETVGKGGGLLVAPTHLLEPEVPWENIEALIQAVKDYGTFA